MQPAAPRSINGQLNPNLTVKPNLSNDFESSEIICRGLSKQFQNENTPAVNQVSFKVAAGDLVVILGPSGCGKTTLLKMINRLYEPNEGEIFIGGQDIRSFNKNELRRQIGYVIQQVGLFPHMTIKDNIAIVPRLKKWDSQKIQNRVAYLLEMVGLQPAYLTRYPRQLSGGEQQRVGLARALAADPLILLMDEPFAAVDAINRNRLQEELLDIHQKLHKTILFVTHDVEEAFCLADKIMIMKNGRLIQYGTPLDIVTRPENRFVEELVGTDNLLRKLSLINVQNVLDKHQSKTNDQLTPLPAGMESYVLHAEDDLRQALSELLASGQNKLAVVDKNKKILGEIGFADLHKILMSNLAVGQKEKQDELPLASF